MAIRESSLDTLIQMHGDTYVINDRGYWVKFVIQKVPASRERPHGLNYSLTLHNPIGNRLLGFDNAHPISKGSGPGVRTRIEYDHKHRGKMIRFYEYRDAGNLISDFWAEVEAVLQEEGEA